jgi:hypothetical protein
LAEGSTLRVPTPAIAAIRRLARLPNQKFEALAGALAEYPGGTRDGLIGELSKKLDIPPEEIGGLVDMAVSVEFLRKTRGWSGDEIVAQLAEAEDFPAKTKAERRALAERVGSLIEHRGLSVVSNALSVALANAQTLQSARIVTDLRTVFADEADTRPAMALVVHVLEMVLHIAPDGHVTSSFVALDDPDLDSLSHVIDVARTRSAELRAWLPSAGLKVESPFGPDTGSESG